MIPARIYRVVERIIIVCMILGLVGMFQPWRLDLYTWGFHVLLVSTLIFIIYTHIPPREDED